MSRVYYHPSGEVSPVPISKKQAKKFRASRYATQAACESCGKQSPLYTYNDKCTHCMLLAAIDFYNLCMFTAEIIITDNIYRLQHVDNDKHDKDISKEYAEMLTEQQEGLFNHVEPATPSSQQAYKAGHTLWLRPEQCSKAGHLGVRTMDGTCYYCDQPSPRQKAVVARERHFMPDYECKQCNTTSLRLVSNSQCTGCKPTLTTSQPGTLADARETPDSAIMRKFPDMIVSKKDALAFGMKVYRTGKQCNHGHSTFRYVSTGSCISCLRS